MEESREKTEVAEATESNNDTKKTEAKTQKAKKSIKGWIDDMKKNPQTLDEAKQKTKSTCILVGIIFAVFAVLFVFLHFLISLIWIVVGAGIIAYLYFKWSVQNVRNFCSKCGLRINYEDGVAWEVVNYEEKRIEHTTDNNSDKKRAIKKRIATVDFTCTCLGCGEVKKFSQVSQLVRSTAGIQIQAV